MGLIATNAHEFTGINAQILMLCASLNDLGRYAERKHGDAEFWDSEFKHLMALSQFCDTFSKFTGTLRDAHQARSCMPIAGVSTCYILCLQLLINSLKQPLLLRTKHLQARWIDDDDDDNVAETAS